MVSLPQCVHLAKWTYEGFIISTKQIHGDLYNYSNVTNDLIANSRTKLPIICNKCNKTFFMDIIHHIHRRQFLRNANTQLVVYLARVSTMQNV